MLCIAHNIINRCKKVSKKGETNVWVIFSQKTKSGKNFQGARPQLQYKSQNVED